MSKGLVVALCVGAALLALPLLSRLAQKPETLPAAPAPTAPVQSSAPAMETPPSSPPGTPAIVSLDPPNGATNVSPGKREIRATFNMPMGAGFSWTGGGPTFPGAPNQKPYWTPDRKTCVLPIALQPNSSYRLGLNSPSFKNFRSESGVPLTPVVYKFSTGPAGS